MGTHDFKRGGGRTRDILPKISIWVTDTAYQDREKERLPSPQGYYSILLFSSFCPYKCCSTQKHKHANPQGFFSGGKKSILYPRKSATDISQQHKKERREEEEGGGTICIWMAGDDDVGGGITFTLTEHFLIFPPFHSGKENVVHYGREKKPLLLCQTVPRRRRGIRKPLN